MWLHEIRPDGFRISASLMHDWRPIGAGWSEHQGAAASSKGLQAGGLEI
jgi:hypothetical protein